MKIHGRAKLRLSRGRRGNPGSDGASPYPETPDFFTCASVVYKCVNKEKQPR
jgi:hypothetical protein